MKRAFAVLALTLLCSPLFAQSAAAPAAAPTFEVASVRMVKPLSQDEIRRGLGNVPWSTFPTNRFTGQRISLKMLISIAYGVDSKYIQGDPIWLESQEYSIEAKAEGDKELTYEEMQPLLQHLLQQRFHLVTHRGTKTTSGIALIIAKGGPKLTPAKEGVTPHAKSSPMGVQAYNMDIAHFVTFLSLPAGGPVIDKTGLSGRYDIKLSYAPANDPDSTLPSIFTAVQEQLGLKLVRQKVPVETLVIDHVDKIPTEN
ncbi:MAG: TIGR03435 family protein [Acidobacteriaceae bacterium]